MATSPYLTLLGLPDLMNSPNANIEAFSELAPSMAASLMATERPDEFWSSDGLARLMYIVCGLNEYGHVLFPANAVSLVSHNLWQESAQYRVVALTEKFGAFTPCSYVAPNGDSDRVNVTGAYTDVNGSGPGVTKIRPTSTGAYWAINLDFATPGANPRVYSGTGGAHYQSMHLFVKASANAQPHLAPAVTITVFEGGTGGLTLASVSKRITEADGQYIYLDFSTSVGNNGSNITLFIEGDVGLGGDYIEGVYFATWSCETTEVSAESTLLYDSGWQRLPQQAGHPTAVGNSFHSRLRPSTLLHQFGETVNNIDWVYIFIREDHCPGYTNTYEVSSVPSRPPGYLKAGKVVIGETWTPTNPPGDEAQFIGILNMSPQDVTRGGQEFGAESARLRTATVTLDNLTKVEGMFILERLVRERGVLGPIVVALNPDGEYDEEPTTFYATLEDSEISLSAKPGGSFQRAITLRFKEML